MSFADDMEQRAMPIRRAILEHPFVTGVGDGTLSLDRFRHYVLQDYVYLIEYSRVLAMAASRARDLETMSWFARLLDETLNVEMDLHRNYCAQFGITTEELESTMPAPTTVSYTSYLLNVAHQGSFPEIVASLVPCQWGYWEIGEHLALGGEPADAPLYCQWIQMYTSPEFVELAGAIRNLLNRLGDRAGIDEQQAMGRAYLTSLRYEYLFWEMSYNLEAWPV